jgi:putative transposase
MLLIDGQFLESLIEKYDGKHSVYSDGGSTWYPEACKVLKVKHYYIPSPVKKNLIAMVIMQYFKDRTEEFDDYYPCNSKRRNCDNSHVYNWIELFVSMYNNTIVAKNNLF